MSVAAAAAANDSTAPKPQPMGLVTAGAIGAAFVLAAAAVILRIIPAIWDMGLGKSLSSATNEFVSTALQLVVQAGALIGLIIFGAKLGANAKHTGIRGAIFLTISVAFTVFFCGRAIAIQVQSGFSLGQILAILFNGVILFLVVQMFRTGTFQRWCVALDDAGWFDTFTHKRTQGLRVRRLTILGILMICGSGIWALSTHNLLPSNATYRENEADVSNRMGDWVVGGQVERGPTRIVGGFTLLKDLDFTIPLVLIAATLWFSWRLVNYPVFADFLIATEAEMNKVSWTPRKALARDTAIVLVSLVLITAFLFVVDIFWGKTLGAIGVLPKPKAPTSKVEMNKQNEW